MFGYFMFAQPMFAEVPHFQTTPPAGGGGGGGGGHHRHHDERRRLEINIEITLTAFLQTQE